MSSSKPNAPELVIAANSANRWEVLHYFTESRLFQNTVIGVIIFSVLLVGIEGYPEFSQQYGGLLDKLEYVVITLFTIEISIRIASYGPRPWRFFLNAWNVFDFVIVAVCYLPNAQFSSVLRLVRVLRILRLVAVTETEHKRNDELRLAYKDLDAEKARSEWLLRNILPELIADRLKDGELDRGEHIIADNYDNATVLFADIVGFTTLSTLVEPNKLISILNMIFSRFDELAEKHGVEKIKTIGDAYMAVSGVPTEREDHTRALINMALDMRHAMDGIREELDQNLEVRIGLHCGPVIAGVIGQKKFIYDLWGDTVNVASRMESHGKPRKVHVTEDVYNCLNGAYEFTPRGTIAVKGHGEMQTYFLEGVLQA